MSVAQGSDEAGGIRAAFAYRDYRWLVTGLAISSIGSGAYSVALIVYVWEATQSPTWAAAVTLGRFVPALLFSTYGGIVAERVERRRLLITVDCTCATIMITLAVVTGLGAFPLVAIVLASLSTILGTVYLPATFALTPQIVEEKDLAAANAVESVVDNVATIVGPALGALLLVVSSVPVVLLVNAATFLISALCSRQMHVRSEPSDVTDGGSAGVLKQVVGGFRAITSSSTASVLVGASLVATLLFGVDTVLFVVLSEQRLGLGPDGYGLLLAGLGVGGVLMSTVVNRLAASRRLATIISAALILYTLPTVMLVWFDQPTAAFAIQIVRGAATLVVDVLAITALQRSLPKDMIARVFGAFTTLMLLAISLGALGVPPMLALVGLDGTLFAVSVGASALVVLFYPFTRRVDREMTERLATLTPRIDALSGLGIFGSASRTAIERLAAAAVEESASSGTRIVVEGEPADAFFVVTGGTVAVIKRRAGGEDERLQEIGPGGYFGEIGLLEEGPRTASIDALTDVGLLRVPGPDFIAALMESAATPAFMEAARMRLITTDPDRKLTARALEPEDS